MTKKNGFFFYFGNCHSRPLLDGFAAHPSTPQDG